MAGYLKRLLGALGAYQIAGILQKLLAVLLLPVYTGRIAPGGYGIVETLATFVIFVSIVARFGIIESFLRYYFIDEDPARRDALVRRSVLFLIATTTVACIVLVIPAAPLSHLITSEHVPGAFRVSVLGIWSFTNLELAQAVLRVDERLRAYAVANSINVVVTVAASLVLVVGLGKGYEGLLIANYGTSTVVLFGLWWHLRKRLLRGGRLPSGAIAALDKLTILFRFGLPTVPAEASVYALSVLDRQYIVHSQGAAAAGRYAIAIKVAGAIAFIVTAFQYAWPPLAYSVTDDAQAARLYGLVTTYYALITGWVVAGLALEDRFIIRVLTPHPGYFGSYRAIPWVALGWAMYGLWVVLLVVAGRAKVTGRNFPAALVGLAVNVLLLILLVPRYGIAGGGIALCGAYVAMLGVMHMLIRRAFPVSFEWRRLVQLAVVIGGLAVAGDLLLPTSGFGGFASRAVVFLAIPAVLWLTGFVHRAELDQGLALLRSARARIGTA
ncbi:MAG TPA: oligosaccharide flippase family protein [Solirubrobacteraceae bacterium]|nr:oligosaccharide flippase family protein [Solirubrobacteraceae bacterium]